MFFSKDFSMNFNWKFEKNFCINNFSLIFYWFFIYNVDVILFKLIFYLIDKTFLIVLIIVEIFFKFVVKNFNNEIFCFVCFVNF